MINNKSFLIFLSKLAEVYAIGHFKYAPGTWASLIALVFGYYILITLKIKIFLLFVFIFVITSYLVCEAHIKLHNKKDPKEVVVDEFGGQFVALLGIIDSSNIIYTLSSLLLSFLLFRFFDITKIGPIKKFEELPGGIGIIADDLVAGLCAFLTQAAILTSIGQSLIIKTL
ncbi:phosphatidylglycerophosphatase A [Alphaproteobacteria bacterium]|nr:phosphatidylglycerophosphatase A [Alphaproteobacteria bacterium]